MAAVRGLDRLFPNLHDLVDEGERELAQLEPAWGKAALFFRTGNRLGHGPASMRCMSLLEVHRMLEVYRKRYEAGDTLSVLHAVSLSAEENLPLPQWLALAFKERMSLFALPGKLHSLDQVFSSVAMPTGSPKKAASVRIDWNLGGRLWSEAWDLVHDDQAIQSFDAAVTGLLAKENFGVGKTKAKSLILMVERNQSELLGRDLSLSRFLAKRRKRAT